MILHRVKLTLVVVAACASVSCLDERVSVPVRVATVDASNNVKPIRMLELVVRKGQKPFADEQHHGERWVADTTCASSYRDDIEDPTFVAGKTTSLDGTASFDLLPGDYVLCSRRSTTSETEWAVPFHVESSSWEAARLATRGDCDCNRTWVYREEGDDASGGALLLSNNNNADAHKQADCAQAQTSNVQAQTATGAQAQAMSQPQPASTQPRTASTPGSQPNGAKKP